MIQHHCPDIFNTTISETTGSTCLCVRTDQVRSRGRTSAQDQVTEAQLMDGERRDRDRMSFRESLDASG